MADAYRDAGWFFEFMDEKRKKRSKKKRRR
jgi:hypothetical protein